jgi:hypothetical protein
MTPETEGSSVTRPEIGAGFAGIFELLEAPDYRLAQHGPHTPSVPKGGNSWQNRESPLVYDLVSLLVYGSYTKAYTNKYTSGKKKRDIRTLLYPHVSSFSSSRSISIIVTEY